MPDHADTIVSVSSSRSLRRSERASHGQHRSIPTPNAEMACFVISVAARLLNVHPQTLRYYERAGLISAVALAREHPAVLDAGHRASAADQAPDR